MDCVQARESNAKRGKRDARRRKSFKEWKVDEVHDMVKSLGEAFVASAKEMKENGIDGDFFLKMIESDDDSLTTSIAEGGIGFKKLQLKVVKDKISKLDGI